MIILLPVSLKNKHFHGSYALSSQNGSHLQNWVSVELLMAQDNISRKEASDILRDKLLVVLENYSYDDKANPFFVSTFRSHPGRIQWH
mgnify:CR=1 FL=1